jgi:hypothetical protein
MTFNDENLTKPVKRKWIRNKPEIKSHSMGTRVKTLCQISRGSQWLIVAEKSVTKISYHWSLMSKIKLKLINRKWMSNRPEMEFQCMGPCANAVCQISRDCEFSCWENCYKNFLPMTINVENLTKPLNRKWMSDRPEINSHSMGPRVNAVC